MFGCCWLLLVVFVCMCVLLLHFLPFALVILLLGNSLLFAAAELLEHSVRVSFRFVLTVSFFTSFELVVNVFLFYIKPLSLSFCFNTLQPFFLPLLTQMLQCVCRLLFFANTQNSMISSTKFLQTFSKQPRPSNARRLRTVPGKGVYVCGGVGTRPLIRSLLGRCFLFSMLGVVCFLTSLQETNFLCVTRSLVGLFRAGKRFHWRRI